MPFTRVFTVEGSSVADGNSDELTESDNDDWIIEKIKVIDEEGNLGNVTDATVQISGNSLTDQVIPLAELTQSHDSLPVWNAYWPANKQLRFSYTNEAGNSITLDVVVYVRSGEGVGEGTAAAEILETPLGMA